MWAIAAHGRGSGVTLESLLIGPSILEHFGRKGQKSCVRFGSEESLWIPENPIGWQPARHVETFEFVNHFVKGLVAFDGIRRQGIEQWRSLKAYAERFLQSRQKRFPFGIVSDSRFKI